MQTSAQYHAGTELYFEDLSHAIAPTGPFENEVVCAHIA